MGCCDKDSTTQKTARTNVHIHLHTTNLEASTEFYAKFFGEAPVKTLGDYSKFLPSWAPINLALSPADHVAGSGLSHFGIQVPDSATVTRELGRVKSAGLQVREEMGVNCCHANQDKFWVVDPNGIEWEVYCLNYDIDEGKRPAASVASGCCER